MSKISFIYFDVGGVAIRDFSVTNKWVEMKDYMGVSADRRDEFDVVYNSYSDQVCMGLDIDSLIPEFNQKLGLNLSENFSINRYFVDHFDANPELLEIVTRIKSNFKVGLLTDMYPGMLNLIFDRKLLPQDIWDVIVDSSVEKVKKPMPKIFTLATKKANVPAAEILFIDNNQQNLDVAKTSGWQTFFYDSRDYVKSSRELSRFLEQLL